MDETKFGKYEIRGKLGQGAMGTVMDVFDPVIERRAALKIINRPAAGDAEGLEAMVRFKREAQAAGRLSHPHIVAVYDYGEDAKTAWIAMELVEGGSLKDILDRGERLPLARTCAIMDQVLSALDYSHKRGVVHRDIKPANIMLTGDGQVKIADFGIARIENSSMTQVGTVMGTPSYMAPEQLRGETVDSRADIWAAAVMLYQLVTGEKPFPGGYSTLQHTAINTEPKPPSQHSVTVPPALDGVIARAMAKRPDGRFATAGEFAAAIRAATAPAAALPADTDATVVATGTMRPAPAAPRPPAPSPPAGPAKATAAKGPPVALIGGGVAVLAAAGAAAFFLLGGQPAAPPANLALATPPAQLAPATPAANPATPATPPAPPPALPASTAGALPPAGPTPPRPPNSPAGALPGGASALPSLTPANPPPILAPPPSLLPAPNLTAAPNPGITNPGATNPGITNPAITNPGISAANPPPPASNPPLFNPPPITPPAANPPTANPAATSDTPIAAVPARPADPPLRPPFGSTPSPDKPAAGAPQQLALAQPRADFRGAAAALAATPGCGLFNTQATDNSLALAGIIRGADEVMLRRSLAGWNLPAGSTTLTLQSFEGPYCPALEALRPALAGPRQAPSVALIGQAPLREGQLLRFDVTMPVFAAQLSVAYLQQSGEVAHLVAGTSYPPGTTVRQGEPRTGFVGWEVSEPFGTDLLVAVVSEGPLFATPRPEVESVASYVAALNTALAEARRAGRRVHVRPLVVETAPR